MTALLMLSGRPTPVPGVTFLGINMFMTSAVLSRGGHVGFIAGLSNGEHGLFAGDSLDTLAFIAQSGAEVPGGPEGLRFIADFRFVEALDINRRGQVVFLARFTDGTAGLFVLDPELGVKLLARTEASFEVAPGDVRTVAALGARTATGGDANGVRLLNDHGQFAFAAEFADGSSGVFRAQVSTAPERRSTLSAGLGETGVHLAVFDGGGFPAAGTLRIDDELLTYRGRTGDVLFAARRGALGSTATDHDIGAPVALFSTAGDASCDGVVDSADLLLAVTRVAVGDPGLCGADADLDGDMGPADLPAVIGAMFEDAPRN